jgi:hypothetical protein
MQRSEFTNVFTYFTEIEADQHTLTYKNLEPKKVIWLSIGEPFEEPFLQSSTWNRKGFSYGDSRRIPLEV